MLLQNKMTQNKTDVASNAESKPRVPRSLYVKYPCQNLRFLLDFFTATGLTPYSFGQKTDNPLSSAQALRVQLNKDDMKISRAKEIVGIAGYQLDIDLLEKDRPAMEELGYTLILPEDLQENLKRGGPHRKTKNVNLAFLQDFLYRNRVSRRRMAEAIDQSAGCVETWFNSDDIAISYLFRIKEVYPVELIFTISPNKKVKGKRGAGRSKSKAPIDTKHRGRNDIMWGRVDSDKDAK